MRILFILPVVAFFALLTDVRAQSGCTDPAASNYNSSAITNNGSCTYPYTHYDPQLRAAFGPGVSESSGVVFTDGKFWTHNDSGNQPNIFSVDTSTGAILQTVFIDNYLNTDWEDITADSNYIYVGDFGNNNGTRTDLKILKIAKADITTSHIVHLNAQAISFSYTDQTSFTSSSGHNFDCESVISIKDSLYIFTKDRGDGATRVYKLPKVPGTYPVSPYTGFNVGGLITGADYNPSTREIVLIGYLSSKYGSFLWFLSDYTNDQFFSGNKRRVEISNGGEWQTEGVCWLPGNRFFISCELTNSTPSSFYICNRNLKPSAVNDINTGKSFVVYPNPAYNTVNIKTLVMPGFYKLADVTGRFVSQGELYKGDNSIDIARQPAGLYRLLLYNETGAFISVTNFCKQ